MEIYNSFNTKYTNKQCGICLEDLKGQKDVIAHSNGGESHPAHAFCIAKWVNPPSPEPLNDSCLVCNKKISLLDFTALVTAIRLNEIRDARVLEKSRERNIYLLKTAILGGVTGALSAYYTSILTERAGSNFPFNNNFGFNAAILGIAAYTSPEGMLAGFFSGLDATLVTNRLSLIIGSGAILGAITNVAYKIFQK